MKYICNCYFLFFFAWGYLFYLDRQLFLWPLELRLLYCIIIKAKFFFLARKYLLSEKVLLPVKISKKRHVRSPAFSYSLVLSYRKIIYLCYKTSYSNYTCFPLSVCYFCRILSKLCVRRQIVIKTSNINFHKIPSVNARFCMRMDKHYVTNCFSNAPKLTVILKC
jgi:hypothetical protein